MGVAGKTVVNEWTLLRALARYLLCAIVLKVILLAGWTSEMPESSVKICWRAKRRACPCEDPSPKSNNPGGAPGTMAKGCVWLPVQKMVWPATKRIGGNDEVLQRLTLPTALITAAMRPVQR